MPRGFTLIEIMIVITIIGLVARIALPRVSQFRLKGRAARIVADLEVVRGAAFHVLGDSARWPLAPGLGVIPPEMQVYLPPGLSFHPEPGVVYDWRLTDMPGGDPGQAGAGATMGMGAEVDDPDLRTELQRALAGQATLTSGSTVYWLLWGPTTRP